ncbi:unnamed protein product [Acanthoscelides obtectus]|uniref:Small ribosomal subunit protein uS10m n=1 Tax=Acanthoscelides obtectus TaxID=200917 RepID=A0A9P0M2J5_ACAOB|nr:unnamed protein product [Acanthoscelides obtectus]CAK1679576.1 28S ribosomal protein S10, mitochondrial [Acanthoscelides obtectus]
MMNFLKQFSRIQNVSCYAPRNLSALATAKSVVQEPDKLYKVVELELRGNDPAVLKSFCKFASTTGQHLEIDCKTWNMRKPTHERFTVLKCVHIYKKHRVQYEYRTYYSFVQYKRVTGSTADTLLEYIERNLPEGVSLKATKVEVQELPDYLSPPKDVEKTIEAN